MKQNYIIAFVVVFLGLFVMANVGWLLGVIALPFIIGAAGYLIWNMIKTFLKQ